MSSDAEDILSEIQDSKESEPQLAEPAPEPQLAEPAPEPQLAEPAPEPQLAENSKSSSTPDDSDAPRDVIYIGKKPIMTYMSDTLTQLSSVPVVTIKARGKRITEAIDVSQMIVKRMDEVGYEISDVRISSVPLTSKDGKNRNVSTIELDIKKLSNPN